jgi:hypothetical protein
VSIFQIKATLQSATGTLMTYVKYMEHLYMYEDYYAAIQPSNSNLLGKYKILLNRMMTLLCAYRNKMVELGIEIDQEMIIKANRILYKSPTSKTVAEYEALMICNTYREDYLAFMELLVFNSGLF